MRIFRTLLLLLALDFTYIHTIAQCNSSEIVDICKPKLPSDFMLLKSYEVNGKDGLEKVEFSYPFVKGTDYIINLCPQESEDVGMVVTLFDYKRNELVTSDIDGQYATAIVFSCKTTGIYYIKYTFKKSNTDCGGSVIGFKVKG